MSESVYPAVTFHYEVEAGDGMKVGFTEVSGLDVETEVIEYRHGASPEHSKVKMPGMQKFSNITLKRGVFAGDNEYYKWWNTVQLNSIERRDVTVKLLGPDGDPIVVWKIRNAWPIKVQSPGLKSDASEAAIESIELVHEGLTIQND